MTYLEVLNKILSMTQEQRLQNFELYEEFGMYGVEPIGRTITDVIVNGNGEVKALVN